MSRTTLGFGTAMRKAYPQVRIAFTVENNGWAIGEVEKLVGRYDLQWGDPTDAGRLTATVLREPGRLQVHEALASLLQRGMIDTARGS